MAQEPHLGYPVLGGWMLTPVVKGNRMPVVFSHKQAKEIARRINEYYDKEVTPAEKTNEPVTMLVENLRRQASQRPAELVIPDSQVEPLADFFMGQAWRRPSGGLLETAAAIRAGKFTLYGIPLRVA